MQGDAYWALAMAINVYLTFYRKYDARQLRKMEIPYLFCCYGIPLIPGLTFIFVSNQHAGRPYGDAVLWCWLKSEWEVYRIATFYGPIWYGSQHSLPRTSPHLTIYRLSILVSISIYTYVGRGTSNSRSVFPFTGVPCSQDTRSAPELLPTPDTPF
jgi:hypothetical protein